MSRVPIRLRVTLAFAAVMALVLAAAGLFLYNRLEAQLDEQVEQGLRSRAGEVSALVQGPGSGLSASSQGSLIEQEESFAQVLTLGGTVVDSTPQLRGEAVLHGTELREAATQPTFFTRAALPGVAGPARLLAAPVDAGRRQQITVVGSSLEDRDEALASIASLLAIGAPLALFVASLAGYGVASIALRPVEAMRRRAAQISAGGPDERLPVPAAQDELSRLARTLNEMLGRLEAALERERRFVDDASHELRTPLALHKTELELALKYARGEGELRTAIDSAVAEIDRVIQLAEDLLVVARSEEGTLAVAMREVAVSDLLDGVGHRFGARARQAERRMVVDAGGGGVVEGDRVRLEQALTNLVDNAFRHGGGEVRLSAKRDGERVQLHVRDQGPGFPPQFLDRAFERFSRADPARGRGGSGLGLAIVETIARAHGGRAQAQNPPGGGADVWIEVSARR